MSELHDKAQVLVLYFDGRAPVLTRFHDDPIDLAATIRDLLAENERLRADRDALHKMTRCQCSDDDACAFAVRAIAAEARLRELASAEPVAWRPVAEVMSADDQRGESWLALNTGQVVYGVYEWRQGRHPDGWNTAELGRVYLSDVSHCAPFRKPEHPLIPRPEMQS